MLEIGVSNGERFIHDQSFGTPGGCHRKGDPHLHTAGVGAHWLIKIASDFCKGFNVWQRLLNLLGIEPHQPGSMANVFTPTQFRIEPHPQLKNGGNSSIYLDLPL